MRKILITDALDSDAFEELNSIPTFEITLKTGMDEQELVRTIPDYHAAVVRGATQITRSVINAAINLKLIIRAGIGLDNIDLVAAQERGIQVANTPAATSISVAEHAIGLMLAAARNQGRANLSLKEHKWERNVLSGTELFRKTLGIIGMGKIGLEVAKRALGFGMNVIAFDIIKVKTNLDIRLASFESLLTTADIISLHVPLTEETRHIISNTEFRKMKDGVIIIHVSRGGTVNENALLRALKSKKVRAAGLDVFEEEPPGNFSLIDHPNVVATPHIGAAAKEGQKRAGMEVVKILKERFT